MTNQDKAIEAINNAVYHILGSTTAENVIASALAIDILRRAQSKLKPYFG